MKTAVNSSFCRFTTFCNEKLRLFMWILWKKQTFFFPSFISALHRNPSESSFRSLWSVSIKALWQWSCELLLQFMISLSPAVTFLLQMWGLKSALNNWDLKFLKLQHNKNNNNKLFYMTQAASWDGAAALDPAFAHPSRPLTLSSCSSSCSSPVLRFWSHRDLEPLHSTHSSRSEQSALSYFCCSSQRRSAQSAADLRCARTSMEETSRRNSAQHSSDYRR